MFHTHTHSLTGRVFLGPSPPTDHSPPVRLLRCGPHSVDIPPLLPLPLTSHRIHRALLPQLLLRFLSADSRRHHSLLERTRYWNGVYPLGSPVPELPHGSLAVVRQPRSSAEEGDIGVHGCHGPAPANGAVAVCSVSVGTGGGVYCCCDCCSVLPQLPQTTMQVQCSVCVCLVSLYFITSFL